MRWERGQDPVGPTWTTLDNQVIDDDLSCRALGLLTRWLRRPPGAELDSITDMIKRAKWSGKKRLEGRDALYAASYELEALGYLVRELVTGPGGRHEWVVRIYSQPVPPEQRSDPEERKRGSKKPPGRRPKRPRETKPQVGPITGFQEPGNQESVFPDSGEPDSEDQASSLKDSHNDSLSGHGRRSGSRGDTEGEREPGAPTEPGTAGVPSQRAEVADSADAPAGQLDVQPVMEAYLRAFGAYPPQHLVAKIRKQATELLTQGWPIEHVAALAGQMPAKRYTNLLVHAGHNPPPAARPAVTGQPESAARRLIAGCDRCDEYGWILDDDEDGPVTACTHPAQMATT